MRFSVVVPAFNESVLLPACLEALLGQQGGHEVEVIVVDNDSSDGTGDIARGFGVTVLHEPRRGYSAALACGFSHARGDVIASTDADSVVPRDWIARLAREYERNPRVVAVGGAIRFTAPSLKGRLFTDLLLPLIDRVDWSNPKGPHLWGANLSVRRAAYESVGGFDPRFSLQADSEISERLRSVGKVMLLPDLKVHSSSRRWNRAFWSSCALFGGNFVWYHVFRRPMVREFPAVREHERRAASRRWRAAMPAGLAAMALLLVGWVGYKAFVPRSNEFGPTYWNVSTTQRVVALTFDDGPNEPYTSQVLAILRKEHVHATFFLIGTNVRAFPQTAAEIVREGNVVGNHTDTHPYGFALQSPAALANELSTAERTISSATGVYPRFFRPPNGLRSPWLMGVLTRDSLTAVTWDDAPGDWDPLPPEKLVSSTLEQAHPGAIILLHDGLNLHHGTDRSRTVKALPAIIAGLRREGYRFVTVPELLGRPTYLNTWPDTPAIAHDRTAAVKRAL